MRDSYKLALASMLIAAAVSMQLPLLPSWLAASGCSSFVAAAVVALPGLGVFALGCFCSYLVQHYRRNTVCMVAAALLAVCFYVFYRLWRTGMPVFPAWETVAALRFVQGSVYGLASMVLLGTLAVDASVSSRRTAANILMGWFLRAALPLGPVLGLLVEPRFGFGAAMLCGGAMCLAAVVLVLAVKFPFKAPDEIVRRVSADRFFMRQSLLPFVNLVLFSVVVGLVFSRHNGIDFYHMMLVGLLLSIGSERLLAAGGRHGGQIVSGLILSCVSVCLMAADVSGGVLWLSSLLFGHSAGLVGGGFLRLFVETSPHCRRGTSQSMYFLACELGLSLGIFTGLYAFRESGVQVLLVAAFTAVVVTVIYFLFTRRWYISNVNR